MINGLALYTGNGGLEAALHLVLPGYRTVCAVERQAYAAAAFVEWLEKAGLGACPVWDDATTFDPLPWRGLVDIISAGFPCQPYSGAGKGLRESDPRDGWPHVFRTVRALMPPIFWGENVATIITRGRHSFKSDLESLGYRVAAGIYSAAEVGAPHLRERLFILGTLADSARLGRPEGRPEPEGQQGRSHASFSGSGLGDADGLGRDRRPDVQGRRQEGGTSSCRTSHVGHADNSAERPGLCPERAQGIGGGRSCDAGRQVGNPDGAGLERVGHERAASDGRYQWPWPAGRGAEQYAWEKPRLAESGLGRTTHGVGARNEQLLCLGNGVVPVAGALAFVSLWEKLKRGA